MLLLHGPLHGKVGFTHFLYCSAQQSHPYRVVGWWLTVQKKRELPPALKTDSGLSSLQHPRNTNQESQTLEVREQVNHPRIVSVWRIKLAWKIQLLGGEGEQLSGAASRCTNEPDE